MHSALLKDLLSLQVFVSVATTDRDCATTLLLKEGQNSMTKQTYRDRDKEVNVLLGIHLYIMTEFNIFLLTLQHLLYISSHSMCSKGQMS